MYTYIIKGTTLKERAILEYNNISYVCLETTHSNFPIKDVEVQTIWNIEDVINLLERPRTSDANCAKLILTKTTELVYD